MTPTIDDIIFELNGSSCFPKLYLYKGYHQVELATESRYITIFIANQKTLAVQEMFELSSAAEMFQNVIQTALQGIQKATNISNDMLVHGCTQVEHDDNLRQVFERMKTNNLKLNREKCVFNKRNISFFGHVWSPGVSADPKKLDATRKMNTRECRGSLVVTMNGWLRLKMCDHHRTFDL